MEDYIRELPMGPTDSAAEQASRARWDAIAKPIGSLGALEEALVRIATLTGSPRVDLSRRCVTVFCADNGVIAQGVSQSSQDVTYDVANSVARGRSSVNHMAAAARIDCVTIDMGTCIPLDAPGVLSHRIAAGTADITQGPAMTRAQALEGIRVGVELVGELASEGYRIVATGEVGMGNTTTATAMACAFLGIGPERLAGRGAGLSDEGLERKVMAIRRALEVNEPDSADPLDILAKLGGFDIAGMCGAFLGGAVHRVPIVVDGLISTVAAYCATRLRPECRKALLASHLSAEPAARLLLDGMGLKPVIDAGMRLGEGTGAICLMPLLDMACSLYSHGSTFDDCGIVGYEGAKRCGSC